MVEAEVISRRKQEMVDLVNSVQAIKAAFETQGWPAEIEELGNVVRGQNIVGAVVGVEVTNPLPDFSVSMDYEGRFVWIWAEFDKPNRLAVVSSGSAIYIDTNDKDWHEKITKGVKQACVTPGYFIDFELGGRDYSYERPVYL